MGSFLEKRKKQLGITSLGDLLYSGKVTNNTDIDSNVDESKFIFGPSYVDRCVRKWSRNDLLGIIGGAGVGKTTFILNCFFEILKNNRDNDGVVVFVSLEMTIQEVADKWFKLTKNDPELSSRLYIIENYDENGVSKELSVKGIKHEITKIKQGINDNILTFCIDHLHELRPDSGLNDFNPVVKDIKNLAVEMNTFGILLSQTTKGKAGVGDLPIDRSGCYGSSRFEWLCSSIITISQPLIRVQKNCTLPVLAFQYAKIRYKNKLDKIKESMNYLLMYDFDTEKLRELNNAEKSEFTLWLTQVEELREAEEKYKSYAYDTSQVIKGKNGKEVILNRVSGGETPERHLKD